MAFAPFEVSHESADKGKAKAGNAKAQKKKAADKAPAGKAGAAEAKKAGGKAPAGNAEAQKKKAADKAPAGKAGAAEAPKADGKAPAGTAVDKAGAAEAPKATGGKPTAADSAAKAKALKAALEALFTLAQQLREVHQGGALQVLHLAGDRREQGGERVVQGVEDLLARLGQLGQGPHHLQGNPLTTVPQSKLLLQGAPES